MALVTTKAIILHSMRWGEADRILTFFSLRLGKVRGIARGARRMTSRFGGTLELFASVNLTLFEKRRDDLASVSQVDSLEPFTPLRETLEQISAASRMVALTNGVTADRDPAPSIFHTLLDGLRSLVSAKDPGLLALMVQLRVLGQSGFRPQLDHCASCGRDVARVLRFSPSAGGLVCASCDRRGWDVGLPVSPGSVAFLRRARRMPVALSTRLKATGRVRTELETMIDTYARTVVGKRLPSTHFPDAVAGVTTGVTAAAAATVT